MFFAKLEGYKKWVSYELLHARNRQPSRKNKTNVIPVTYAITQKSALTGPVDEATAHSWQSAAVGWHLTAFNEGAETTGPTTWARATRPESVESRHCASMPDTAGSAWEARGHWAPLQRPVGTTCAAALQPRPTGPPRQALPPHGWPKPREGKPQACAPRSPHHSLFGLLTRRLSTSRRCAIGDDCPRVRGRRWAPPGPGGHVAPWSLQPSVRNGVRGRPGSGVEPILSSPGPGQWHKGAWKPQLWKLRPRSQQPGPRRLIYQLHLQTSTRGTIPSQFPLLQLLHSLCLNYWEK